MLGQRFTALRPPFHDEIAPYSCSPPRPAHRYGLNPGNDLLSSELASHRGVCWPRIERLISYVPPPLPSFFGCFFVMLYQRVMIAVGFGALNSLRHVHRVRVYRAGNQYTEDS